MPSRRPPPPFRRVTVSGVERRTPRLVRLTLAGDELDGFPAPQPAASVRLLLPVGGALVIPEWTGNEFLLPDGSRPPLRTLTPRRFDATARELDVEVVLHGAGLASGWAASAEPGSEAAVSGPGRGYDPGDAEAYVLAGDETAIAAMGQLVEQLPDGRPVTVHVELATPEARVDFPARQGATVQFHEVRRGAVPGTTLVDALAHAAIGEGTRLWAAGEAAAMQRIRVLLRERGIDRARTTVRGYWKHGRVGDEDDSS